MALGPRWRRSSEQSWLAQHRPIKVRFLRADLRLFDHRQQVGKKQQDIRQAKLKLNSGLIITLAKAALHLWSSGLGGLPSRWKRRVGRLFSKLLHVLIPACAIQWRGKVPGGFPDTFSSAGTSRVTSRDVV